MRTGRLSIFTLVVATALAASAFAVPTELRFTEVQMPLGTTNSQVPLFGLEYLAFGISVTDAYRYHDSRDPFSDGAENQFGTNPYGLSLGLDSSVGSLRFTSPVSNLEVDWWTIVGTFFLDVFDSSDNLIHSFSGVGSGTELINLSDIGRLEWHDSGGFVQISNIRFEAAAPEPATGMLLVLGLGTMALLRRKQG